MKKTNNANSGRAIANTGAFEHNAAMTELWQSTIEVLMTSRDWNLIIDSKGLNEDIEDLGQAIFKMASEAIFESIPVKGISYDTLFEMVCQAGRSLYRGIKYSQLDKHVKAEILLIFEDTYDLRKTSGQRRWHKLYLQWLKE